MYTNVYKDFFEEIVNPCSAVIEDNVTACLAILASRRDLVGISQVHMRIGLTTCGIIVKNLLNPYQLVGWDSNIYRRVTKQIEIENVFDTMHGDWRPYDFEDFDPSEEEVVPADEMEKLVVFANGITPE